VAVNSKKDKNIVGLTMVENSRRNDCRFNSDTE